MRTTLALIASLAALAAIAPGCGGPGRVMCSQTTTCGGSDRQACCDGAHCEYRIGDETVACSGTDCHDTARELAARCTGGAGSEASGTSGGSTDAATE